MPIFEYICEVCGYELEIIQRIKDRPLTECPTCNEQSLRKKLSVAAFHLKGSGWYETDFKNKKTDDGASKKSKSEDAGDAAGGDSKKKESDKKTSEDNKTSKSAETTT